MKKKVLSAIVCAAMVFSMTACGLQSPNTATGNSGTTNAATSDAGTSDAEAETQRQKQHPQAIAQQNRLDRQ